MRWWRHAAAAVLLTLLIGETAVSASTGLDSLPAIVTDTAIPLSKAGFGNTVLLVNFWASWCVPCQRELPSLDRLVARRGDLVVIAVSVDADRGEARKTFAGRYPHLHLAYASLAAVQAYGALGVPYSVILDRHGHEVRRVPRALAWDGREAMQFLPPP
jgi:thiol-disulfide isomerase/thioredoxin